jgi:hypothetical protein
VFHLVKFLFGNRAERAFIWTWLSDGRETFECSLVLDLVDVSSTWKRTIELMFNRSWYWQFYWTRVCRSFTGLRKLCFNCQVFFIESLGKMFRGGFLRAIDVEFFLGGILFELFHGDLGNVVCAYKGVSVTDVVGLV